MIRLNETYDRAGARGERWGARVPLGARRGRFLQGLGHPVSYWRQDAWNLTGAGVREVNHEGL
jgi:hypothetical protein